MQAVVTQSHAKPPHISTPKFNKSVQGHTGFPVFILRVKLVPLYHKTNRSIINHCIIPMHFIANKLFHLQSKCYNFLPTFILTMFLCICVWDFCLTDKKEAVVSKELKSKKLSLLYGMLFQKVHFINQKIILVKNTKKKVTTPFIIENDMFDFSCLLFSKSILILLLIVHSFLWLTVLPSPLSYHCLQKQRFHRGGNVKSRSQLNVISVAAIFKNRLGRLRVQHAEEHQIHLHKCKTRVLPV